MNRDIPQEAFDSFPSNDWIEHGFSHPSMTFHRQRPWSMVQFVVGATLSSKTVDVLRRRALLHDAAEHEQAIVSLPFYWVCHTVHVYRQVQSGNRRLRTAAPECCLA